MSRNRRSPKNFFVRPRAQIRTGAVFISLALLVQSAILLALRPSIQAFFAQVEAYYRLPNADLEALRASIESTLAWTAGAGCALGVLSLIYGIRLSHRIYGPLVPFQRHVRSLTAGDFTSRVRLRADDEMRELGESLNELAESLQKKT